MTAKKATTLHGVLMYPISIGGCALIFHWGQFIRTSRIVAIHQSGPDEVKFETLNTHYTLLLDPAPATTAMMPAAA